MNPNDDHARAVQDFGPPVSDAEAFMEALEWENLRPCVQWVLRALMFVALCAAALTLAAVALGIAQSIAAILADPMAGAPW